MAPRIGLGRALAMALRLNWFGFGHGLNIWVGLVQVLALVKILGWFGSGFFLFIPPH